VSPAAGLVVVDKPAGVTSHDVVARVRRLAGTRKVGHAGTLDPMATGVLILGVERATKLLGYLALTDKEYTATIRLGESTVTDDAEGELVAAVPTRDLTSEAVRAAMLTLTGAIEQVPSSVSAIKVDGKRSYARVRAGETVQLKSRPVTVTAFDLLELRRPAPELVDLDVRVECTTGTYVRALARDLGAGLGVGGHLTALRRTRVGPYRIDQAHTLDELAETFVVEPLAEAADRTFPRVDVGADTARAIGFGHGIPLPPGLAGGPFGVFDHQGRVLALMAERDGQLRSLVVFEPVVGPGTEPFDTMAP